MNAIESYWSGVFNVEGKQVTVNTNVINDISPKGGYLPITLLPESGRSGSMYIYCDGDSNLMWTIAPNSGNRLVCMTPTDAAQMETNLHHMTQ